MIDHCYLGDVRDGLRAFAAAGVRAQTCVTSPPYWGLRDYGVPGQLGLEPTVDEFIANMVEVFRGVWDVLADDGTLWVNMGDSYATGTSSARGVGTFDFGSDTNAARSAVGRIDGRADGLKPKDLVGQPWRLAFALQNDGWYLRSDIIWAKKNPMPESITDRPTKSHEYLFLLSKQERYFYDADAIKEPASEGTHARRANDGAPSSVAGWMHGPGAHSTVRHAQAKNDGDARKLRRDIGIGANARPRKGAPNGSGTKNNPSFDEAMAVMPLVRNKRTLWHIASEPYSEAHFATFPTALVEPCILAGTSQRGHCPACGKGWKRVVERELMPTQKNNFAPEHRGINIETRTDVRARGINAIATTGWRPSCACNAGEPLPGVVLDPFMGSGTTAQVAQSLGRRWIGCELNPQYFELQQRRTAQRGLELSA